MHIPRTPHGSSQKDLVGAREGALGDAEGATLSEETKVVGDTDGLTLGALEGERVGMSDVPGDQVDALRQLIGAIANHAERKQGAAARSSGTSTRSFRVSGIGAPPAAPGNASVSPSSSWSTPVPFVAPPPMKSAHSRVRIAGGVIGSIACHLGRAFPTATEEQQQRVEAAAAPRRSTV